MTRILITGATGNVGAATLQALLRLRPADTTIVAAGRNVEAARRQFGTADGLEYAHLDFAQLATADPALQGVSRLLLLLPPGADPTGKSLLRFIDAAKAIGVQHVVYLSVQGAQWLFFTPHAKIERHLRRSGLGYTLLRPSFFMQNLSTVHQADIRDHDHLLLPAGRGRTAFIDVRDIGEVAAQVLLDIYPGNAVYELTGTDSLDYYQVTAAFSQVLGRLITYKPSTIKEFQQYLLSERGFAPEYARIMVGVYLTARLGLAGRVTPTVRQLLGREPISLRQFIEDYRASWEKPHLRGVAGPSDQVPHGAQRL